VGCDQGAEPVAPVAGGETAAQSARAGSTTQSDRIVTSDADVFAVALAEIGNENEVQVVLKDPTAPRIARMVLEGTRAADGSVIGIPETAADAPRRQAKGFGPADAATRAAYSSRLEALGAEVYREYSRTPILSIRMDDADRTRIARELLTHPAVDFIESNQRHPVQPGMPRTGFDAARIGPALPSPAPAALSGAPPIDDKHRFHRVRDDDPSTEDAWDITRGAGARIGILDSGMSGDFPGIGWHPYAVQLSSASGVMKLGFADDYQDCPTTQADGDCEARDDNFDPVRADGHGTMMSGYAGANDNNSFVVGIAPDALVVSMKLFISCFSDAGVDCEGDDTALIEDDDFQAALDWAIDNDLDVVSMSWGTTGGIGSSGMSTVSEIMLDAAYNNDVLLLASTGNDGESDPEFPVPFDAVMGVGGLLDDGTSVHKNAHEEVSALSGGWTLNRSCPMDGFCSPIVDSRTVRSTESGAGGTSASSAIAAGIAGLVRAANPTMTAPQVRQRLIDTADNFAIRRLDAWRAITNTPVLRVRIDGETCVEEGSIASWTADVTGGRAPFSYVWKEGELGSQIVVGTGSSYGRFIDESETEFQLMLEVTDDPGQFAFDVESIEVGVSGDGDDRGGGGGECSGGGS